MKLNRKLRQRCWLEVKHFVLDDSLGSFTIVHFNFHECSEFTSIFTSESSVRKDKTKQL